MNHLPNSVPVTVCRERRPLDQQVETVLADTESGEGDEETRQALIRLVKLLWEEQKQLKRELGIDDSEENNGN